MNIFVLDKLPERAAEMHCDKHVVKQLLETAQIISTVTRSPVDLKYKPTHAHHPCVKWAIAEDVNLAWLFRLAYGLGTEYRYRYGKTHKSMDVIGNLLNYWFPIIESSFEETPSRFTLAMPLECQTPCPVASYRLYYLTHKRHLAKWTRREPPHWWE